jgi:polysaccharide export outer membrane protein
MKKIISILLVILFFSCASRKDVVYYQNIDSMGSQEKASSYEVKIQPDDLLSINVSAEDAEAAMPFNLNPVNPLSAAKDVGKESIYLVDVSGYIDFPVLGKIKVSGLTRAEILMMFQKKISNYVKNPIVTIVIKNFKIAVQGEVAVPGIYPVVSERITLIEALSLAGDLTIYGKRHNILIIREIDGVKSYNRVDITKADFINSQYYYLAQNDVVYVEPNKSRISGSAVGANTGVLFSAVSILLGVITLILTIK